MKTIRIPEVVMITGVSAGIGRATAQAFAWRGARIGLLARDRALRTFFTSNPLIKL